MSGGQPPYYGFSNGPPYYPQAPFPGAPPTSFQNAGVPTHFPQPGAPPACIQQQGGPPTYYHPPQHFPVATSVTNYYPAGETHFTSSNVHQSHTSMAQGGLTQGPRWVHWQKGHMVPAYAVEAGYDCDRSKIYVGRVHHKGDLIPAKAIPQKNVAYVAYAGQEIGYDKCEVTNIYGKRARDMTSGNRISWINMPSSKICILCQEHVNWVRSSEGRVPPGATAVGRTSSGETLYACRVHHHGSLTVGKVHPSHHCCYISFGGNEVAHKEYEVLVA